MIALVVMLGLIALLYCQVRAGLVCLLHMLNHGVRKICHHFYRWLLVPLEVVGILAASMSSTQMKGIVDQAEPGITRTAVEVVVASLILFLAILAFVVVG